MSRREYKNVAVDSAGNALSAAQVEVRDSDGALVTLYSASTGATEAYSGANPFLAGDGDPDDVGLFSFYVDTPKELVVTVGIAPTDYVLRVYLDGPYNFETRADLVTWWADNSTLVPVGTKLTAGGLEYINDGVTTTLPSLSGLAPFGDAHSDHWGVPATGAEVLLLVALQWSIDNNRPLKIRGDYTLDDTVDFERDGLVDVDCFDATFRASASWPVAAGTRMFFTNSGTSDGQLFRWRGGTYLAENMPQGGTLSGNNVIDFSCGDKVSAMIVTDLFVDMSDGVNSDYRNGWGDSGVKLNADRVFSYRIRTLGANDLGVYITGSSNPSTTRSICVARDIESDGCRNGAVQVKRQFKHVDIKAVAKNSVFGGGCGFADDTGGNSFLTGVTSGTIDIATENVAYPIRLARCIGVNATVTADKLGFYLVADGATGAAEIAIADGGMRFDGAKRCTVNATITSINSDLVTALGGGYVAGDFTGVIVDESTGAGTGVGPVTSEGNVVHLNLTDIPRPVKEDAGTNNTYIYSGTGDTVVGKFDGSTGLIRLDGAQLSLESNNNSGPALNGITLKDVDGSGSVSQHLGFINFETSDGGGAGVAAGIRAELVDTTGRAKLVFYTGQGGSAVDRLEMLQNGEIEILGDGDGITYRSPDGTRYKHSIANGGTVSVTAA